MSQENVELVRRMYEGAPEIERLIADGEDLAGHRWLSLWHPDCVLEDIAELGDSTEYRGRDGISRYLRNAFRDAWDEWRFVPREVLQGGDGVFAAVNNTARSKSGIELEVVIFQVFRVLDGMIV